MLKRLGLPLMGVMAMGFALASGRLIRRYVVEGRSMLRAFAPGDRLVVEGVTYRFRAPRIGEVVVVRWPNALSRPPDTPQLDLKRVAASPGLEVEMQGVRQTLGDDEWCVLGDNLGESQDSRTLGPVKTSDIVGRVWFRY